MPFPSGHNVLQVFGTSGLQTAPEIWSFRLRIGRDGSVAAASAEQQLAILQDIQTDLTTWWNALGSIFSNHVKMTGFKFVAVGTDGKYVSDATTPQREFPSGGLSGTAAGSMLPPQCTVAVTLRTAKARGLAAKGRIFLPAMGSGILANDGRLAATQQATIATATGNLLTNLNNWPGIDIAADPGDVSIYSNVREGDREKVTRVEVGNVIDTQRRRRNALIETRVGHAVT